MKISKLAVSFFISLNYLFIQNSFSGNLDHLYDQLKGIHAGYERYGVICEQIARLQYEEQYPEPEHSVVTGIEYVRNGIVIGELDVVVFDNATDSAILVGEVKCGKQYNKSHAKAERQKDKFYYTMSHEPYLEFRLASAKKTTYRKSQFKEAHEANHFYTIAPRDAKRSGFDMSLDYTLNEILEVRRKLLGLQY